MRQLWEPVRVRLRQRPRPRGHPRQSLLRDLRKAKLKRELDTAALVQEDGAANIEAALREIRMALLEADVNFKVVKAFVDRVRGFFGDTADWDALRDTVELSTRFLDDVVEANAYVPAVPQLKEAAHRARRIGQHQVAGSIIAFGRQGLGSRRLAGALCVP